MFLSETPDRASLREAHAEKSTFELEQMRFLNPTQYSEFCLAVLDELLQERPDRSIGVTEKFCANCGAVTDIHAAICPSCGLSCDTNKTAELKELQKKRKDWHKALRIAGLAIIVGAIILAASAGDLKALGQAAIIFALVLAFFVGGTTASKFKRVSVQDPEATSGERRKPNAPVPYVVCPSCREQVFLELHPDACPKCGERFAPSPAVNPRQDP